MHASSNRYATLFYAEYDPATRRLMYVNAGHNPPVVLRSSAGSCQVLRLRDEEWGEERLIELAKTCIAFQLWKV